MLENWFQKNSFSILSHGNNVKSDTFLLTWNVCFCERMQCQKKKTKYKSKVQKTIRFWISFFKLRHVLNQKILKMSVFEPKFLQLVIFRRDDFTACQSLSQHFYPSTDFEITSLQRVQFSINDVKLCPTSSQFFKTRQILIRDFYSVSDFEIIFLATPQFLNRKNYEASDLGKTLILGEQNSLELRFHKVDFWCQFTP